MPLTLNYSEIFGYAPPDSLIKIELVDSIMSLLSRHMDQFISS